MITLSYFELKRGKKYKCSLDSKNYDGKFEYKLHKHFLVYRPVYHEGKIPWSGVWNVDWYNEMKASYLEIIPQPAESERVK